MTFYALSQVKHSKCVPKSLTKTLIIYIVADILQWGDLKKKNVLLKHTHSQLDMQYIGLIAVELR